MIALLIQTELPADLRRLVVSLSLGALFIREDDNEREEYDET